MKALQHFVLTVRRHSDQMTEIVGWIVGYCMRVVLHDLARHRPRLVATWRHHVLDTVLVRASSNDSFLAGEDLPSLGGGPLLFSGP